MNPKEPSLFDRIPQAPDDKPGIAKARPRLIHSTPEWEVHVEPDGNTHFFVTLVRDQGTRVASVRYSRKQLEQLIQRGRAALTEVR